MVIRRWRLLRIRTVDVEGTRGTHLSYIKVNLKEEEKVVVATFEVVTEVVMEVVWRW